MIGQMERSSNFETILRHDRMVVAIGLITVVALSTVYTIFGLGMDMSAITMTDMAIRMPGMAMPEPNWSLVYGLLVFAMWTMMMIAMMLPSAAPMLLIHSTIGRKRTSARNPAFATACFAAGYLCIWAGFSALATLAQWLLYQIGVLSGMMQIASPVISGLLLIAAGLYQLTPLKQACAKSCQHPIGFITRHWQNGNAGAFRMGLIHGILCLGCCWFLMILLFAGGIMNLLWIAGLAVYVAIEKFSAGQKWLFPTTGSLLIATGLYFATASLWT